jgi:hypothetical protein
MNPQAMVKPKWAGGVIPLLGHNTPHSAARTTRWRKTVRKEEGNHARVVDNFLLKV